MVNRFLEDILEEDNKKALNTTIGSKLSEFLDTPFMRHPVATSTLAFLTFEYLRYKYPETFPNMQLSFVSSYGLYSFVGIIKEYLLEARNFRIKGLYPWILNNPKIVSLAATIASGFVTYYGESEMPDVTTDNVPKMALGHAI